MPRKNEVMSFAEINIPNLCTLFVPFRTTNYNSRIPTVYLIFTIPKSDYKSMPRKTQVRSMPNLTSPDFCTLLVQSI